MRYVGGQLHIAGHDAFLEPDDERLRMPIRVKGKLPPGARTRHRRRSPRCCRIRSASSDPLEVRIVETFEPEEFVQYEIRRILLRESVSEDVPRRRAGRGQRCCRTRSPRAIGAAASDLRAIPLLTIDPADARDHDDAVWAERLPGGGYRVLVAIADVSHYVREGSALDREAIERGCTIYLPSRAIPMLPPELSSNLASLLPKRDRLTLGGRDRARRRGQSHAPQLHRGRDALGREPDLRAGGARARA